MNDHMASALQCPLVAQAETSLLLLQGFSVAVLLGRVFPCCCERTTITVTDCSCTVLRSTEAKGLPL